MAQDQIVIRGAREHNLKDITVALPRDRLIVITGLSGSGKSSLAFDTIYAEGQRRYVESLSAYTRLLVLGPLIKDRKTEGDRVFDAARRQGFVRVRVDGEMYELSDAPTLDKYKRHSIEVVVDRYIVRHAEAPEGAARDPESGRPI